MQDQTQQPQAPIIRLNGPTLPPLGGDTQAFDRANALAAVSRTKAGVDLGETAVPGEVAVGNPDDYQGAMNLHYGAPTTTTNPESPTTTLPPSQDPSRPFIGTHEVPKDPQPVSGDSPFLPETN